MEKPKGILAKFNLFFRRKVEPFAFQHRGMLAYIGGKKALADTPLWKQGGFFAWLFWNAAYITKLVSLKNKVMIPMYWFKSYLFGRDITRFDHEKVASRFRDE
jgi:NADH dehydrogenase FAD-containing subunit